MTSFLALQKLPVTWHICFGFHGLQLLHEFMNGLCVSQLQSIAGIETGQTIQMEGEGGPAVAKNGTAGNLFVEVNVAADKVLHRKGSNIHVTIYIDFVDAIMGSDAK